MKVCQLRKRKPRGRPRPRVIRVPITREYWSVEYVRRFGTLPPHLA